MSPAIAELVGWAVGLGIIALCVISLVMSARKRPTSLADIPWRQIIAAILFVLWVLLLVCFIPYCLRTLADPTAATTLLR